MMFLPAKLKRKIQKAMNSEEIKDSVSMSDILARYGLPKPNRAGFICCPFHNERTASMRIYKKDFHCFGCGANGDVFTFVQMYECVSFKEAYKSLGGTYENHENEPDFASKRREYQRKMRKRTEEIMRAQREQEKAELREELKMLYWFKKLFPPFSDDWCYAVNRFEVALYHLQCLIEER